MLVAALLSNIAFAIPGVPNAFYGYAFVNGQPAENGTQIIAKINGVQAASTTTMGGKYGYDPAFYVEDPNQDRTGKAVTFFINGVDAGQTYYFCNACVTPVNLSATISPPPPPSGGGGTAPSGGGGGAVVTQVTPPKNNTPVVPNNAPAPPVGPTTGTTDQPQNCNERWLCEDWSNCADGSQTRVCEEVNKCGTEDNKPLISQPCTSAQQAAALSAQAEAAAAGIGKQPAPSTGFATLAASLKEPKNIGIAGLLVAGAALVVVLRKKNNKK